MKPANLAALLLVLAPISSFESAANPGLATRDMNPILQPIFLPGYISLTEEPGWRVDHTLYITNTLQQKTSDDENVLIDVENYRYELNLGYRQNDLVWQVRMPYIVNQGGSLDNVIDSWHDFFGLPDGKRNDFPRDQIDIEYVRDGEVVYSQTESSSGIGDVSIALGHHPAGEIGYFVAIELPTGSESNYTGNEGIDIAFWLLGDTPMSENATIYGLFGITLPADDGALEGLVADHIWVAQAGLNYRFADWALGYAQLDLHSESLEDSDLRPFGPSVQIQLGLGFDALFEHHRLDLFFSEDIYVGSAPDITFGVRLARTF
jgi:hypothetical protein